MFEGVLDHPIWDIILLIIVIRMFIPFLFQIRVYSSNSRAVNYQGENEHSAPGKVTISVPQADENRKFDSEGEYVDFEEIKS